MKAFQKKNIFRISFLITMIFFIFLMNGKFMGASDAEVYVGCGWDVEAIGGLIKENKEQQAEINNLKKKNEFLEKEIGIYEQRFQELCSKDKTYSTRACTRY